ncbi:WD40 repeat-like protein [Hymenopellis radicata]|nr:WD40 repeat-like protein [Hymenopellis radicata]
MSSQRFSLRRLVQKKEKQHNNASTAASAAANNAAVSGNGSPGIPSKSSITTASVTALHGLHEALKVVKEASDVFLPLKSVVGGLLACVDAYQKTAANHEGMEKAIRSIDGLLATLVAKRVEWQSASKNSHARIVKLEEDLNQIIDNINDLQKRGYLARLADNAADAGELVSAYQKIADVLRAFQFEISLDIERNVQDILNEVVIRDLRCSRDASFRAAIKTDTLLRGPCTSGTRVKILDKIMSWARDNTADSPPVFWLTGLAGTGKTTIAYTICERMWAKNKLLISFFCSRQLDSKDSQLIVPTICRNLAELFRSYATELVPILQGDFILGEARIHEQIDNLLVVPWSASLPRRDGIPAPVVIIDALDESDDGVEFLKNLLRVVGDKKLTGIKFLVTSRVQPEIVDLCHSFQLPANMICHLHEVPLDDVQDDIAKFLAEKLPKLRDTDEFTQLSHRAGGLFISAATAVRYISPSHRTLSHHEQQAKLRKLLRPGGTSNSTLLLDRLYEQVLTAAFDEGDEDLLHPRLDILHAIVCAQELISISVIAQLLGLNQDTTKMCIDSLHSVLYVSPLDHLVSCYHASFPEFILDAQRSQFTAPLSFTKAKSQELKVFCDKSIFNARLAHHCFRIMRSELHFNICHLSSSSMLDHEIDKLQDLVQMNISLVLRYAACHWGEHLFAAGCTDRLSLHNDLKAFLTNVFLFLLEAMNLITSKSLCFSLLQYARRWLKLKGSLILFNIHSESKANDDLSVLLDDAVSFAIAFAGSPASQSTPHLYISCLSTWSFSAPISKIWKPHFTQLPLFLPASIDAASSLLIIPISARSVTFSPDDLKLASIWDKSLYIDNHIRIWDSTTGELLQELVGHTKHIASVSFSDDGAYIVSASLDTSIYIWDALTGEKLRKLLGHTKAVQAVAFSHNTQYIVSGSWDMSVRIWARDSKVENQLKQLDGHTDSVQYVAFSHDDTQVVSSSYNRSVRIWDVKTGQQVRELISYISGDQFIACSPCSPQIASGSADNSVRIWNTSSGKELKQFKLTSTVTCIAFSHNGQKIVLGLMDYSIQIWDVIQVELLNKLTGHTSYINFVMFSHDGTRIVSSANDHSIRVWNTIASERPEQLEGHTGRVQRVAFSSDGKQVISSSLDKTIQVWDVTTGRQLKDKRVTCLSFSPDSTQIIAGLHTTGSLIIWDSRTGAQLQTLKGHKNDEITCIAFVPNTFQLVSGSQNKSIRIWNLRNGENIKVLTDDKVHVTSIAVSIDGKQIVSGSHSSRLGSVIIWDVKTGELLRGHTDWVTSVAFSPDGTHIVSGSRDTSVRVWRNIEDGDSGSWHIDSERWIWSHSNSLRLMWLSRERYNSLLTLETAMIMSRNGYSTVSFEDCYVGADWYKCYEP